MSNVAVARSYRGSLAILRKKDTHGGPVHSLPLFFPPSPLASLLPSTSLRSRSPLFQLGSLEKRCKLPQRDLGRIRSRNRFWYILALKYDIWWQ